MRLQIRGLYAGLLLLALGVVCLPAVARAETASEAVYILGGEGAENHAIETPPKAKPKPKVHHLTKPKTGEEAPKETPGAPEEGSEGKEGHAAPATPGDGGGHPPKGAGHPDQGKAPKPTSRARNAGPTEPEAKPIKLVSAESEGGGSSPVVPILIVVAVLAALSIGTVIYRGRTPQAG
jgi:hypothetical protein